MFPSVLFPDSRALSETPPDFFTDLNLDQVVNGLCAHKAEYRLHPFFYSPPGTTDALFFRHEVFRDLEKPEIFSAVGRFADGMRGMRRRLAVMDKVHYLSQKKRWFLDAVRSYLDAVRGLEQELAAAAPESRGMLAVRTYLTSYVGSDVFSALLEKTRKLRVSLDEVRYCIHLYGGRVKVARYDGESDYTAEVERTFEKFRKGDVKDYSVTFSDNADMNHVEAMILDRVALLFPETFAALGAFYSEHKEYLDEVVARFDTEVQFYLAYGDFMSALRSRGLPFCYPVVSDTDKETAVAESYDVALASKLLSENKPVVCNDFFLSGNERIIIVSGPNQGGKTTFARSFGQIHYLASLGCPVPARRAKLFLFDRLFVHFEREETGSDLRGKLQDDLVRIHGILESSTSSSIVIMNEIFNSTTLKDAVFLARNVLERIMERDAICVCVTFMDELSTLSEQTVSMVSTVVADNPAQRTFKIVRKAADGIAYAMSIAEKHRLTYVNLMERVSS